MWNFLTFECGRLSVLEFCELFSLLFWLGILALLFGGLAVVMSFVFKSFVFRG